MFCREVETGDRFQVNDCGLGITDVMQHGRRNSWQIEFRHFLHRPVFDARDGLHVHDHLGEVVARRRIRRESPLKHQLDVASRRGIDLEMSRSVGEDGVLFHPQNEDLDSGQRMQIDVIIGVDDAIRPRAHVVEVVRNLIRSRIQHEACNRRSLHARGADRTERIEQDTARRSVPIGIQWRAIGAQDP